jgi:hypothetical protein
MSPLHEDEGSVSQLGPPPNAAFGLVCPTCGFHNTPHVKACQDCLGTLAKVREKWTLTVTPTHESMPADPAEMGEEKPALTDEPLSKLLVYAIKTRHPQMYEARTELVDTLVQAIVKAVQ